ncbi:MAG: IS200/IS605 family accessory protein TnpB-related protein [Spirochaetota bacterium]
MQVTIQTKIIDKKSISYLERVCEEIGGLRSLLLRDILQNKNINDLKKQYISEYGLMARQFNSLSNEVRGSIKSAKELKKLHIKETKSRLEAQKKSLKKLHKKLKNLQNSKKTSEQKREIKRDLLFKIHHKNRKLVRTQHILEQQKNKDISICLGGKKLFLAQYHLKENGYKNHQKWLATWQEKRNNRVFCIGSKDEKLGNQNCQLLIDHIQLRIPPCLEEEFGKYIQIPVEFTYNEKIIQYAIKKNQAINYRFARKNNQWYVFLTTKRPPVEKTTNKKLGAIGVDINKAHLAWGEINRHGNVISFGKIPVLVQERTSNQISASFGEAVKQIVEYAKKQQKPIVVENLDFSHKKTQFALYPKQYRRMLSHFAYAKFFSILCSKAYREGVEVIKVNPAFSSLIGFFKFAVVYGISVHIAAAIVLARRGLWFSEFVPSRTAQCLAVHRHWHVWKKWRKLYNAVSDREKRVDIISRLVPSRGSPELHLSSYS